MYHSARQFILALFFLLPGCNTWKKFPVKGKLEFYQIDSNVDSEIARYYLEEYLGGQRDGGELHLKTAAIEKRFAHKELTHEILAEISEETSVDFAALYFANRLLHQKQNRKIQRQFLEFLDNRGCHSLAGMSTAYLIMLVPGLDYVEGKGTGADLQAPRRILESLGFEVRFIPLDPMGTVDENARMISLFSEKEMSENIIIAGPSSAGPAIHLALGRLLSPGASSRVRAWVNLGGILNGSPLADWISSGVRAPFFAVYRWIKGWRKETFDSMKTEIRREWFQKLKVPAHIFVLNYLGLSLSGNISEFAKHQYGILRRWGPNDALTLLPDALIKGTPTILAPESDHFFSEDPRMNQKTVALLCTVLKNL